MRLHGEVVRVVGHVRASRRARAQACQSHGIALNRFDNKEVGFSIHDVDLSPACPHALLTFLHVISDQDAKEYESENSAFEGKTYRGRATGFTNISRMVNAQKKTDMYLCGYSHVESEAIRNFLKKKGIDYVPTSAPG